MRNNKKIVTLITHILAWICFITLPFLLFFPRMRDFNVSNHFLAQIILANVFLILFYYLNTLVLVPRLLAKEKWLWYLVSVLACLWIF